MVEGLGSSAKKLSCSRSRSKQEAADKKKGRTTSVEMKEQTRILLLALVMASVALGGVTVAMSTLYSAAFEIQSNRLQEIVADKASMIEAFADYDLQQKRLLQPGARMDSLAFEETLGQLRSAHENFAGFGKTGEFTMARHDGDQIVFLLRHRHNDIGTPTPVPFSSERAEPMRRALLGKRGTLIGLDYRGERVLAAYQPVHTPSLGLVAKVDLSEVRRPFIHAGALALGLVILLIIAGTVFILRISRPIVTKLEKQTAELNDAVEQAQATTSFLDTVVDQSPFAMWISDAEGKVLRTNEALRQILGLTDRQIVGKYNVLQDTNLEEQGVMPQVRSVFDDREPTRFNIPWKARDAGPVDLSSGRDRHIDVAMFPISNADETLAHVICQWVDITDQKRAEAELKNLTRTLERRVEERTAELTATNKELEAFAYSVSHDLRAPLRGIDGFSKALLDDYGDKLDDTGKDFLNRVRAGTQRMGKLIDELLKLSRLTQSKMNHQHLDLGEMATKIAAELQRNEPDRRVDFEVSPGLTARGDRALLETALDNLLRNAWKFTGNCAHARVELGVIEQSGERVYFVRDNGAGFDMAYVDKLFGAFQRLHDSTEFSGTGIVLAIVHRVILRHGGRIWAEAEVGSGATFYFTLQTSRQDAGEGAKS